MPTLTQELYAKLDQTVATLMTRYKPYLQCTKGCSKCCETGAYFQIRYAEWLEIQDALEQLPDSTKTIIHKNIDEEESSTCPLLVDNACSVYAARPALCRAYGLMLHTEGTTATCDLNFNDIPTDTPLETLDIDPLYALLDEISAHLSPNRDPQSIRDWLQKTRY